MEVKKIITDSYNLHLIKANQFKNVVFRIMFKNKIDRKKVTKDSLLADILLYSCKEYPTRIDISKKALDLYGLSLSSGNTRLGNYSIIDFYMSMLNEKYTESGMLEESIEFLSELIFNPNVVNNQFNEESFSLTKDMLKSIINRQKDNQSGYTELKMLEQMNKDMPYSCNMDGYIDDLEEINPSNLYEHYKEIIKNSIIDIYVAGNFDEQIIIELINKYFKLDKRPTNTDDIFVIHEEDSEFKENIEKSNFKQSKLSVGCKLINCNKMSEVKYPLYILNNILGGNTDSKLFLSVREKESLAYYINSSLITSDNLILINAGINKKNYKRVLEIIRKEINNIKNGEFSEQEIDSAKKTYFNAIDSIMDNAGGMISIYYPLELFKADNLEQRIDRIKKVSKQDIIDISKNIIIDSVYLLEEGENDATNTN